MNTFTSLRQQDHPLLPKELDKLKHLHVVTNENGTVSFREGQERDPCPYRVGVVLSGGQAPGGHNVIAGLFDALRQLHPESTLIGFLNGPGGLIDDKHIRITKDVVDRYRNQGGFDMIGSGRTKISTEEQFAASVETIRKHKLDGLVIIGGDDSNTNAALLAERLKKEKIDSCVVGVPKTIDGDLKNKQIEISFGFDTATKTYAHTIGNLLRDALSAGKYYFFIKLMGRSASHIALECALQTHPNYTLIGEEIAEKGLTLREITDDICNMICRRAQEGKNYGVTLIPEGTIEFIPEVSRLIAALNRLLSDEQKLKTMSTAEEKLGYIVSSLPKEAAACFSSLPQEIRMQLIMDRDPHGNVQVSKIETERLFMHLVDDELKRRRAEKKYAGKFSPQALFLGYEGRSCYPSCFDANYCYALGYAAAVLIDAGLSGYMAVMRHLTQPPRSWKIAGAPLASMMVVEERNSKRVPVIAKALVDLQGQPFAFFDKHREAWKWDDDYHYPGPIQFYGLTEIKEAITKTLQLEAATYTSVS